MLQPQDEDLEAGAPTPAVERKKYPPIPAATEAGPPRMVSEEEDPRLRWAIVRKVYCILALQCALTAGVSAAACLVRPVPRFFEHGPPAARWPVLIAILLSPLVVMWPMYKYRAKHPANLLLLGLFTLCCSVMMAVTVSTTVGKVVLQAAILTAAAVIGLTLFTFWASNKGYEFTFWLPFLSTSLNVLLVYLIIQIFVPLGTVGMTIFGCIASLVFSGFIIYDTSLLLKRYTYDEYVVAAVSLYLDIINLFMAQITLSVQSLPVSLHSLTRLGCPVHGGSHH